MKKQMLISGIAVLAAAGMVLTGCNKDDSSSSESTAETTAEIATAATEETAPATEAPTEAAPELKIIGTQAEGDSIYQVTLQNHTGKEITGVSVKDSSQEEFPENMLEESDVFAKDESRILYYDATEALSANDTEENASDKALTPEYTIQLTFADDTTAQLHQFPFEDVKEAEIKLEDDLAYLVYTSVSSKTEVNTKEAELMLAETASEAEVQVDTADVDTEDDSYQQEQQQVYVEESETPAETPSYDAPAEETPAADNNSDNNASDPNSGCLGDEGLFN